MAKIWILLRDKFFNNVVKIIGWVLIFIAAIILPYLSETIKNFINSIPNIFFIASTLFFIIGSFIELTYISYLKEEKKNTALKTSELKEDKYKDWEFINKYGIWKKDEIYYCPSCKVKDRVSPLQVFDTGWQCLVNDCGQIYRNEHYNPPKLQAIERRRSWGRGWFD